MKTKFILGLALVLSGYGRAAIVHPKAPDGGREIISAQVFPKLQRSPGFPGGLRVEDLTVATVDVDHFKALGVRAVNPLK